ncbi:Aldo/keto reductase [Mollisia scopiformis]|uniref:Aldo/keto reductase n=1 Tax=Mollisia scopiformis TaxID=149040 RepID=A0A194XJZ2_MOLSC|nr:Aldo/keto reductase [Mollisia scopiformis]KUJ20456.1 Aldo/keto reductase [Mollisia scopiformis]
MTFPTRRLGDGNAIPAIGFGTGTTWYKEDPNEPFNRDLVEILKTAIKHGFRHIDGSDAYGTEEEIGVAIKESGVPREELFVTTKVLEGIYDVPAAIKASLAKLQLGYVDLYLLHSPYVAKKPSDLQNAWLAIEEVKKSGLAKSIGVSNHQRPHLETILEVATIKPALNQLEFHPYLQRAYGYLSWMREHGIEVASFNGLTPIRSGSPGPLDGPLARIAKAHGVTENAVVPVTTTTKEERMLEYIKAVDLKLNPEEVEEITRIGFTHHFRAWAPDRFGPDDRS